MIHGGKFLVSSWLYATLTLVALTKRGRKVAYVQENLTWEKILYQGFSECLVALGVSYLRRIIDSDENATPLECSNDGPRFGFHDS